MLLLRSGAFALALLGTTTACGLVQVHGPGGATGDGAASSDGSGPTGTDAVSRAYAAWSHASCGPKEWCGLKLAAAAGIEPDGQRGGAIENPKAGMQNPDPTWLPGWDRLSPNENDAREFFEALSLAATRRTWLEACKKEYASYAADLELRLGAASKAIEEAKRVEEPYARLSAFAKLPGRAAQRAALPAHREFTKGLDAATYEIERAVFDAFREEGKLWVLWAESIVAPEGLLEELAPRWPAELEERAFCLMAAEKGHGDVPPLPAVGGGAVERIVELVKPVYTDAEREEVASRAKERRAASQRTFAMEKPPTRMEQYDTKGNETVRSFVVDGDKAVLTLKHSHEYGRSIGDVCTSSAGGIGACPVMRVKKTVDSVITFPARQWPRGMKLEQGDRIAFFGDVHYDPKGVGTPVEDWKIDAKVLHLRLITRKDGTRVHLVPGVLGGRSQD